MAGVRGSEDPPLQAEAKAAPEANVPEKASKSDGNGKKKEDGDMGKMLQILLAIVIGALIIYIFVLLISGMQSEGLSAIAMNDGKQRGITATTQVGTQFGYYKGGEMGF